MMNQLKSLELQGYKTFASKTTFEFPGQVTAIVGPNGSGKSNIADAIRWVLGEQAYTVLRGKKTVDMIFSGSEQRPRASMASVSITFDNQNGWLPIDFSEVMITRRAYRSGENEYLLNNQRVRLKEINELLASSGLGERTYTIIGQGLVDSALSLRPEERRRFFEEAAGIGLYRSRREEAVQKLDKTLRNMERVLDIMGELSPRLKSLEKSREKAIQYKQIQDDLFMLLRDWYGFYWHAAIKEMNSAAEFYKQQKEKLETLRQEKENHEAELGKVQDNLNQNRNRLADLHRTLSECHLEREESNRELAILEEREKSLHTRILEAENSLQLSSDETSNEEEKLSALRDENQNLEENHTIALNALAATEAAIHNKQKRQAELNEKIGEIRKRIFSCEASILEWGGEIKNHAKEIRDRKSELENNHRFIEKSSADLLSWRDKLNEIEDQLHQKQAVIQQIEKTIEPQSALIKEKREERHQTNQGLRESDIKKSRLEAELAIILEDENNYSGFSSGSGEIIQASKEGRISGSYQLVLQHLQIPEKYELCVAAALGDLSEGVISEMGNDLIAIIEYISQQKVARTVIIDAKSKPLPHPTTNLPYLTASEIIQGDDPYSQRICQLLEHTLIIEDPKKALEIAAQLKPSWKVVTLNGDVFEPNGIISAGKPRGIQPVKRKREKEAVSNSLNLILEEQAKWIRTLEALEDQLDKEEKGLQDIRQSLAEAKESHQNLSLQKHKLEIEIVQLEKVIEQEKNRVGNIEATINSLGETIPALQNRIDAEKEQINQLKSSEKELDHEIRQIKLDDERLALIQLTSKKAVAEQLLSQHYERITLQESAVQAWQSRIADLKSRIENLKSEQENVRLKITELSQNNNSVKEKIDRLNKEIAPLEQIVESVIGQQGKLLEEVDKHRQNFAIAERHTLQAQMKVEKLRGNADMLRSKIEEDFGMISGETDADMVTPQPLPFEELLTSLPLIESLPDNFSEEIKQKKAFLRRIGPINPEAEKEYDEVSERFIFLQEQLNDLEQAEKDLRKVVAELDGLMKTEFMQAFQMVDKEFRVIFSQLFSGGSARLMVEDQENILGSGIEIEATLPGRRKQELALLSGGERSLTAVALIFALLKISPTPFCVLDEVDAMLDESNVVRFGELLRELSDSTQFIVITHNRNTVQLADILYGVTMGKDSVSQVISLKLDELTDEMVE